MDPRLMPDDDRLEPDDQPAQDPGDSALDTASDALVGAGEGASFGFDDEIAGALTKIGQTFGATNKGYAQGRDEYRQRQKLAATRSPYAHGAGMVAGAVGSAAVTGGGASLGRLAAEGAVAGLGSSEADLTEGDLGGAAKDTATGAATGVVAGKLTEKALGFGGRLLKNTGRAGQRLESAGQRSRVAVAGLDPAQVANEPGGVIGQAQRMKKLGIAQGLSSKEDVLEQAARANEAIEAGRGEIAGKLKDVNIHGGGVGLRLRARVNDLGGGGSEFRQGRARELKDLAKDAEAKAFKPQVQARPRQEMAGTVPGGRGRRAPTPEEVAATAPGAPPFMAKGQEYAGNLRARAAQVEAGDPGFESSRRFLENQAQDFEALGQIPFEEANAARKRWGNKANFASDSEAQVNRQAVHQALNDSMEASANAADPGLGSKFRDLGQDQAAAIRAQEGADLALNREARRPLGGHFRSIVSAGVLGSANPILGLAGATASEVLRGRERALIATGQELGAAALKRADKYMSPVGRVLLRTSPVAGGAAGNLAAQAATNVETAYQEGGPEAAAQAHYLESMNSPEYRAAMLGE